MVSDTHINPVFLTGRSHATAICVGIAIAWVSLFSIEANAKTTRDSELCYLSTKQENGKLEWDNTFSEYVNEASRRGLTLGQCIALIKKKTGGTSSSKTSGDFGSLSDNTLCVRATIGTRGGGFEWDQSHGSEIKEAKRRGLTPDRCTNLLGLKNRVASTKHIASGASYLSTMPKASLCGMATKMYYGDPQWDKAIPKYVDEAMRRGLSLHECVSLLKKNDKNNSSVADNQKEAIKSSPTAKVVSTNQSNRKTPAAVQEAPQSRPVAVGPKPVNENGVAVIIGNTNYQSRIPSVDFAGNDADAFRAYVIDVLGYDPENIIDLRNATKTHIETAFGNYQTHEGKLWRYLDPNGKSDVTVFYSGHGVPGLKDRRGYLLPVDANAETPEINGFSVDTLLKNLGKLEAKSITVFLDTCFSGDSQSGSLVRSTSGITIAPKLPNQSSRMTVITAAQSDQVASWDLKAKHGLFTKHLLDALYGEADKKKYGNGDGKVVLGEVKMYLDDRMTRAARRQYGRHQRVWVRGENGALLSEVAGEMQVASIAVVPKIKPKAPAKPHKQVHRKGLKPGAMFKDCDDCPEMVVIPRGRFRMGSLTGEGDADEYPLHTVDIKHSLAVGKYEVTKGEWNAIMGFSRDEIADKKGYPINGVSWSDTKLFLKILNSRLGLSNENDKYRLLSEAEWEYVARAGTQTKYHYGDSILKSQARFGVVYSGKSGTASVGSFPPNSFGLHDTHGNLWEWVQDCYKKNYEGLPSDGSAWQPSVCRSRVLRGGSWRDGTKLVRSATRNYYPQSSPHPRYGFRVARTLSVQ
jgi:formylglycine-generating enzyme required for sulfatase activity